jgi:hypothetical protein
VESESAYRIYCIELTAVFLRSRAVSMPALEDRIRALCAQALAANDGDALDEILSELQAAIAEQIRAVRLMAAKEIPRAFSSGTKAG